MKEVELKFTVLVPDNAKWVTVDKEGEIYYNKSSSTPTPNDDYYEWESCHGVEVKDWQECKFKVPEPEIDWSKVPPFTKIYSINFGTQYEFLNEFDSETIRITDGIFISIKDKETMTLEKPND